MPLYQDQNHKCSKENTNQNKINENLPDMLSKPRKLLAFLQLAEKIKNSNKQPYYFKPNGLEMLLVLRWVDYQNVCIIRLSLVEDRKKKDRQTQPSLGYENYVKRSNRKPQQSPRKRN